MRATIESLLKTFPFLTLSQLSGARNIVQRTSSLKQVPSRNDIDSVAVTLTHSRSKNSRQEKRILQNGVNEISLSARRSFPECLEQKLSPEECRDYIEQKIDSAGGHEVGDVNVKIHTPRTPEQLADSYWMVEVPVNNRGHMACDRNDGATSYPFRWDDGISNEGLLVQDISCFGKSAGECCLRIREYGRTLTESGYDVNGQCLSCFVHQEALVPYVNKETKSTDYLDFAVHKADVATSANSLEVAAQCKRIQMTANEVDVHDAATAERILAAIASLETFNRSRKCDGFDDLLRDLYNGATVIQSLSKKIGRFACSVCYGGSNDIIDLEDDEVTSMIDEMLKILRHNSPPKQSSKENCVVVYTNADGEVVKTPELGGGTGGAAHHLDGLIDMPPNMPPSGGSCSPFESQSTCQADEGCVRTKGFDQEYKCMKLCSHATSPSDPLYPCKDDEVCSFAEDAGYEVCQVPDCNDDPTICDEETEFCYSVSSRDQGLRGFHLCHALPCGEETYYYNRTRECPENEVCQLYENYELDDNFVIRYVDYCRPKNCQEDPFICSEDEICFDTAPTFDFDDYYYSDHVSCIENLCLKPDSPDAPSCKDDEVCDHTNVGIPEFYCRKPNCLEDPSICEEGETCELGDILEEYHCRPVETCETDPSKIICPEGWYCGSSPYFLGDSECRRNSCNEDPTICKSHESCEYVYDTLGIYLPYSNDDTILQDYQCRPDCSKCEDGQGCRRTFSLEYRDFVFECVDQPPNCSDDASICDEDEFCQYVDYDEPGICRKNTCFQDSTICNEDQFCDIPYRGEFGFGICRQNTCRQDSSLCEEGTRCKILESYLGICVPNTCQEDPSLCNEDEYCDLGNYYDDDDYSYDDDYFQYNNDNDDDYIYYNSAATCKVKTCVQEPSICNNDQFCAISDSRVGECLDKTCIQDETLCNDGELCIVSSNSTDGGTIGECILDMVDCVDDPSLCDETQFCGKIDSDSPFSDCLENVCVTGPPADCQRKDQVCLPTDQSSRNYSCASRSCRKEPDLCEINEFCRATGEFVAIYEEGVDFNELYYDLEYKCVEYSAIGDRCRPTGGGRDCNPNESFCIDPKFCINDGKYYYGDDEYYFGFLEGRCFAYGEGSCTDESGNFTQENCNENEYCHPGAERCLPRLTFRDCCDSSQDNCGYDDEGRELACVVQEQSISSYYYSSVELCSVACEADSDCSEDEYCATSWVKGEDGPQPTDKKHCQLFQDIFGQCDPIQNTKPVENRCNPSNSYCRQRDIGCASADKASDDYYYYSSSQCYSYDVTCNTVEDCDVSTEWCDTSVGFCKQRYEEDQCCGEEGVDIAAGGSADGNSCVEGAKCEESEEGGYTCRSVV